jgi:hypothetical protein
LSDERIIDLIGRNFVAAAVNLYEVREKTHPANAFFAKLVAQKEQYQGIWIATPDGKLLGSFFESENKEFDWTVRLLDTLQSSLQKFGPVKQVDARSVDLHPNRGIGVQAEGSATLAGTSRLLLLKGTLLTAPQIDSFKLTEKQFAGLRPAEVKIGAVFESSVETVKRLSPLMTNCSGQGQYPEPKDVTEAKLIGTVSQIADGVATITYLGEMSATHKDLFSKKERFGHGKSRIVGYGTVDAQSGRMLSLLLLIDTAYRGFPPYDEPQQIVGLAEWKAR